MGQNFHNIQIHTFAEIDIFSENGSALRASFWHLKPDFGGLIRLNILVNIWYMTMQRDFKIGDIKIFVLFPHAPSKSSPLCLPALVHVILLRQYVTLRIDV